MKQEWIKAAIGKMATTMTALLFLLLVPAAASGSLPLWAVLLLGAAGVVALNAACGVLLALQEPRQTPRQVPCTPVARPVPLRVVRGGRAA